MESHLWPLAASRMIMLGRVLFALAFTVWLAALPSPAQAATFEGGDYTQHWISSPHDGTRLHVDLIRPPGVARAPVLLLVSPYNAHGPSDQSTPGHAYGEVRPLDPIRRGFAVAIVSVRGFGGSGGCWDFFGPGEQSDVAAAIRWAADADWSTGKVGMVGGSYGGGTGIVGLASHQPGLAAVATYAPAVDPYTTLYSGGVPYWLNPTANAAYALAYNSFPGALADEPEYHSNWITRRGCTPPVWLSEPEASAPYWKARYYQDRAATSDVPVFGQIGFLDFNVPPAQLAGLYPKLNGRGLWLSQSAHEFPAEPAFHEEVARFLEGALMGDGAPDQHATVQEAPTLKWRAERTWPPADVARFDIPLRPGEYTDQRGNGSGDSPWTGDTGPVPGEHLPREGVGTWTFTPPLTDEAHIAGSSRLRAKLSGPASAWAVGLLYDVDPQGRALLISRGASRVGTGVLDVRMQPQDWRVKQGHRLGLLLSGSDDTWYAPLPGSGATVRLTEGSLRVPVLRHRRDRFIDGAAGVRFDEVKEPIQVDQSAIDAATVDATPPRRRAPRRMQMDRFTSGRPAG